MRCGSIRFLPNGNMKILNKAKVLRFDYKILMVAEVESEILLGFCLEPANKNDKALFAKLFGKVKKAFAFGYFAKYFADSAYEAKEANDIKEQLRECGIVPAISKTREGGVNQKSRKILIMEKGGQQSEFSQDLRRSSALRRTGS